LGSPYCNSLFKEEGIVGGVDKVRLSDGEYVRIEGPAMVEVLRGSLYLLGAQYETGAKVTILRARRVVAKAISDTELSLVLGPGGFADKPKAGEEMIDDITTVIETILRNVKDWFREEWDQDLDKFYTITESDFKKLTTRSTT